MSSWINPLFPVSGNAKRAPAPARTVTPRAGTGARIVLPDGPGQVDRSREHALKGNLMKPVKELGSKPERAVSHTADVKEGGVFPLRGDWNAAHENKLAEFPTRCLNDQVGPSANGHTTITGSRFAPPVFA